MPVEHLTASMLYDFVQCPHRVWLDLFGSKAERDEVSAFVELLWDRGNAFEKEVIESTEESFVNLKAESLPDRERLTTEAMAAREPLIYGGRISSNDLLGDPDLLRLEGKGYVPGDIKSGAATEGGNEDADRKPKKHYAVQLALYVDILRCKDLMGDGDPFVWDINGDEVRYELDGSRGPRISASIWEEYQQVLEATRQITSQQLPTAAAMASSCKQCHWRTLCNSQLMAGDDLTLIPELGRARRVKLAGNFGTVEDLAAADLGLYVQGKKTSIQGVGAGMLERLHARAQLQKEPNPQPYFLEDVSLPDGALELFFDVETDPMRGICYLHGFVERTAFDPASETYVPFLADEPTAVAEEAAFAGAWDYVQFKNSSALYYYSPYERTTWRQLAERYRNVATVDQVNEIFESGASFDLYHDLIRSKMIWPTYSHSIKDTATFFGFTWRDTEPSGAASIQWYHEWVDKGDVDIRQRILDYNEDDCVAMRVIADAVRELIQ